MTYLELSILLSILRYGTVQSIILDIADIASSHLEIFSRLTYFLPKGRKFRRPPPYVVFRYDLVRSSFQGTVDPPIKGYNHLV